MKTNFKIRDTNMIRINVVHSAGVALSRVLLNGNRFRDGIDTYSQRAFSHESLVERAPNGQGINLSGKPVLLSRSIHIQTSSSSHFELQLIILV